MKWPWGVEHPPGENAPAEVQLSIWNGEPGSDPGSAFDCCIVMIPPECYREGRLLLPATASTLGRASETAADHVGAVLHHAEWTITGRPGTVRALGAHGCPACLADADQAVAHLAEHQAELVAVAQLWWKHERGG